MATPIVYNFVYHDVRLCIIYVDSYKKTHRYFVDVVRLNATDPELEDPVRKFKIVWDLLQSPKYKEHLDVMDLDYVHVHHRFDRGLECMLCQWNAEKNVTYIVGTEIEGFTFDSPPKEN